MEERDPSRRTVGCRVLEVGGRRSRGQVRLVQRCQHHRHGGVPLRFGNREVALKLHGAPLWQGDPVELELGSESQEADAPRSGVRVERRCDSQQTCAWGRGRAAGMGDEGICWAGLQREHRHCPLSRGPDCRQKQRNGVVVVVGQVASRLVLRRWEGQE